MIERIRQRVRKELSLEYDAAALALFRVTLGTLGAVSAVRFLIYGWVDELFVKPSFFFHYIGASWAQPLGALGTRALLVMLAISGVMVALGLLFRPAVLCFFALFTYLQLIDLTNYLNHYYLVSLLALVAALMPLGRAYGLDGVLFGKPLRTLPAAYTWLLRFHIGVVYTFAGIAKITPDWLLHAQPLRIWLLSRVDMPIVGSLFAEPLTAYFMSWAGCLFDLSIPWFLSFRRTRAPAYAVVIGFHVMTRMLFPIGMFPFIMSLSAMLFFSPSFPRRLLPSAWREPVSSRVLASAPWFLRSRIVAGAAVFWGLFHLLYPFRTFLYGGNVHWHEQGMRFSWRVMVREKNAAVTYRVVDAQSGRVWEVQLRRYLTDRQEREFGTQPDMILQLAKHIAREHEQRLGRKVLVFADVIVSLNGRPAARLIDPNADLVRIDDGVSKAAWILPAPNSDPPQLRPSRWNEWLSAHR